MITRGVVYLICGRKVAERLVVSAWSLRKVWDGRVCVLCSTQDEAELLRPAARELDLDLGRIEPEKTVNRAWLAKSRVPEWTPFDETVFLDADTLVTGPIDELFGRGLTLTPNADWVTTGSKMRRWIAQWRSLNDPAVDELISRQLAYPNPVLNAGVFAFRRHHPDLHCWYELTRRFPDHPLPEQTALQLLTGRIEHHWADERFNRLPNIGLVTDDVRIWHFHGHRHCSNGRYCGEVWLPAFAEVFSRNIGGIQQWAGQYDRQVRAYVGSGEWGEREMPLNPEIPKSLNPLAPSP